MIITYLKLLNFRNLIDIEISPSIGINIFTGSNAQGKSNLLEALAFIANGRSFRTRKDSEIIAVGAGSAFAEAAVSDGDLTLNVKMSLHAAKSISSKKFSINSKHVTNLSSYIGKIHNVMFSRSDLQLITGAPSARRAFVDRLLCSAMPAYLKNLQNYTLLIKQKNALLKNGAVSSKLLETLNWQLSEYIAYIMNERELISDKLSKKISSFFKLFFLPNDKITVTYLPNINIPVQNPENLHKRIFSELTGLVGMETFKGVSVGGIHRDDFEFSINSLPLKSYGSQGQQRFVSIAAKLAENVILTDMTQKQPIIFMDDCFSEIDSVKQLNLWDYLSGQGQVFLTSNEAPKERHDFSNYYIEGGRASLIKC